MFDINSLPVSGSVIFAAVVWGTVSTMALGPIVADRTIENTGWSKICERDLRNSTMSKIPAQQSIPDISCENILDILGAGNSPFCKRVGEPIIKIIKNDPRLKAQEKARQLEVQRLERIADMAPSACACAASKVAGDRFRWGLHAGTARLVGDTDNLQFDLNQALHSPACNALQEG